MNPNDPNRNQPDPDTDRARRPERTSIEGIETDRDERQLDGRRESFGDRPRETQPAEGERQSPRDFGTERRRGVPDRRLGRQLNDPGTPERRQVTATGAGDRRVAL